MATTAANTLPVFSLSLPPVYMDCESQLAGGGGPWRSCGWKFLKWHTAQRRSLLRADPTIGGFDTSLLPRIGTRHLTFRSASCCYSPGGAERSLCVGDGHIVGCFFV
ncbi:hypothetical protein TcCL_ESM00422 [Trypanosoma cruzi]|nr:hypothetical protein TcCL_ESM00422 [Trypanosoma cruzi]